MTSTIVPRPIAWITSLSGSGVLNLAPFSFFNGVSSDPPLVSTSVGNRRDGSPKDTRRNIEATGSYVVHVVDETHADVMVESSGAFAPDESEVEALGLKTVASDAVPVARLADAPVAMECKLVDIYTPPGAKSGLIIGEILRWHIKDGLLRDDPRGLQVVDIHRLMPMGRLGGETYSPVRDVRTIESPRA